MAYTVHDWFSEKAYPILEAAFEKIKSKEFDENIVSEFDIFVQALKEVVDLDDEYRKQEFEKEILKIVVGHEQFDFLRCLKKCFNYLSIDDDKELLFVKYRDGSSKICCDYDINSDVEKTC
jgi:hypothetical protein